MKIQPIASPSAIPQAQSNAADARAKAIAAFNQAAQPQQQVVQNQNSIAAEELGAIKTMGQSDIIESEESQAVTEMSEEPQQEQKPVQDPALSRQFAQLAKQEKALRAKAQQQEQSFKAREEALKAREATLSQEPKTDLSKYVAKDKFKTDPLSVLAEVGIQYDDLVQQLINQPTRDPRIDAEMQALRDELKAIKQGEESRQKAAQEQQTQAYQAALRQIETDARALVKADPTYETIKATNSVRDIVELIEQTFQKDGILLSVEEAAQQVEDYLVEEALKITRIDKIKKKLTAVAPQSATSTVQKPVQQTKQQQPMKTLTNMTSSNRQLSAKERAILAFKGELKS